MGDRLLAGCGIVYVFVCLDDPQATAFIPSGQDDGRAPRATAR